MTTGEDVSPSPARGAAKVEADTVEEDTNPLAASKTDVRAVGVCIARSWIHGGYLAG